MTLTLNRPTRYAMTDEDYLPDPGKAMKADWPTVVLSTVARIGRYVAMQSANLLPDTFATDPQRAMDAYCAHRALLADSDDADARRTLISMVEDYVPVHQWPMVALLREALEGEELGDTAAAQEAPNVLMQTVRHTPNLAGEYRTFRHHMRIVDSLADAETTADDARARRAQRLAGETPEPTDRGTYDLLRQANAMLAGDPWMVKGLIQPTSIIGTEDMATPQSVTYRPDRVDSITDGYYAMDEFGVARPMLAKPRVAVGSQTKPNGQLRKSTPMARHPEPSYRKAPLVIGQVNNWGWSVTSDGTVEPASLIYGPFQSTSNVYGYVISYNGATLLGHGRWQTPTTRKQPTTKAERAKKAIAQKATQHRVTTQEAPNAARTLCARLLETQEARTSQNAQEPRAARISANAFTLITDTGAKVTVAKQPKRPFVVTVTKLGCKRQQTRVTAPEFVAAAIANRLR